MAAAFTKDEPQDVTAIQGDAVRLSCHIDSVPEANLTWEMNREPLPQHPRYYVPCVRRLVPLAGVLLIANVQPRDAGNYRCVAVNAMLNKKRFSREAVLKVTSAKKEFRPPVILNATPHARQIKVMQGQSLSLECGAQGFPIPQLIWTSVSPAPRPEEGPLSQTYPTAKTVRFDCELGGNPPPTITWYKDGAFLHINGRIKQRPTSLVLSNSVTDDSGIYQVSAAVYDVAESRVLTLVSYAEQCRGASEAGEVWEAARLLVRVSQYQPNPPTGLRCLTATPSSITVTWEDERSSLKGHFMAYTVHYLLTEGGEERQGVAVDNTFKVERLLPFTNYTLYVRVYSGSSASDQSLRVVCRTGEGVPTTAPEVQLEPLGPTSVRASWSLLRPEKALGQVTEHKVQWRRHGHPSVYVDEVKEDVLEYTITGLVAGQSYDVRVLSATSQGWPELPDDHMRWYTIDMASPGPANVPLPPEVHLTVVNATSIEVTWSMPLENKVQPSGFRLSYRRQTDSLVGPIELSTQTHQYLLTGLDPETQYEVQLQAVGAQDAGGGTAAKSIHTLGPDKGNEGGLVEPPSGLEAEPISPTSIRLSWQPPSTGEDAVSFYTVRYHPVQSALSVNASNFVRSTSLGVEVTDLKPFTAYEFQVRSHDESSRQGPYSHKVECQTKEGVPTVPRDVVVQVINQTTVRVSWKEPLNNNGLLSAYSVLYASADKALEQEWTQVESNLTFVEVSGLRPDVLYELMVKASTQAGLSKASNIQPFTIPTLRHGKEQPSEEDHEKTDEFSKLWVVCIAVLIGILTVLCLIAKESNFGGEGAMHHSNGNGFYRTSPHASAVAQQTSVEGDDHHEEMEFITPMLFTGSSTNIPPAETSTTHLDTKGGYPNPHLNGTKVPLLGNGRVPNGHLSKPYHSSRGDVQLRITENPQFQQQSRCSSCGASSTTLCHCSRGGGQQQQPLLGDPALVANKHREEEDEEWADSTQLTTLSDCDSTAARHRTASNGSHHRGNGQTQCA
ncbi:hypothetical protein B566_EDAN003028 [Ephemera danica]|nr:hypothetical protein B566_EDAN003028 [Ephemera danica]